jgi:hypothetical protein
MTFARTLSTAILLSIVLVAPSAADESGAFLVKLGNDTTSVEQYTRSASRIVVDQLGRSPRVLKRHFEYELGAGGAIRHFALTVTSPGAAAGAPPTQSIVATLARDSIVMDVKRDTSLQTTRLAMPAGTALVALSSPWVIYESLTMRLAAGKADSVKIPMYLIGLAHVDDMVARRMGRDSMEIQNVEGIYHVHVDRAGHILNVVPIKGTAQFTVARLEKLDLAAYTAAFVAGEKQAGAMGALSPRDTVRSTVGSAALWIDYSRPSKRGRVVFGGVVPWGDLWRTGANAATQFRTDKPLEIGGATVPAGLYTLWTVPSPQGWKLIINGEAGQWGTEHKAEKDMFTLDMKVSALADPVEHFTISVTSAETGGVINMDWDMTRASIPFAVKP